MTLGAAAASGSTFTGWSGGCSGAGTCNLTMNADLSVVADFAASPPPTIAGKWQGTFGTQALSFCPAQAGTWTATIDVGDGVITGTWYDSYNNQIMVLHGTFDGTTARWFSGGGDERIDYTARFSGDRVQGTTSGPLCTTESGKIQGAFTGSRVVP